MKPVPHLYETSIIFSPALPAPPDPFPELAVDDKAESWLAATFSGEGLEAGSS